MKIELAQEWIFYLGGDHTVKEIHSDKAILQNSQGVKRVMHLGFGGYPLFPEFWKLKV